jgi:cytochrome P450
MGVMEKLSSTAACGQPPPHLGSLSLEEARKDPFYFLQQGVWRCGDIFSYRADSWFCVFINRPDYIKRVLQTNSRNYCKSGSPEMMMLEPMLGKGLMTSDGAEWLAQRRLIQPAFHRNLLDKYVSDIATITHSMVNDWRERDCGVNPIEIAGEMSRLTFQVAVKCLFGVNLSTEATDFGKAVDVMNSFMAEFGLGDACGRNQFSDAQAVVGHVVDRILEERKPEVEEECDLLSLLMLRDYRPGIRLTCAQIKDQIFTFLMAGHETTAKSLTWALYLLDQHPDTQERARREALSVLAEGAPALASVEALSYCWMTIQEAMRLYPPVWSLTRVAREYDEIGGYVIAPGNLVVISPYMIHRHPQYWRCPETFNPERFRPGNQAALPSFAFMPFSGGSRSCIGQYLAMLELRLVLGIFLCNFRFRLVGSHAIVSEALVTLRPKHGVLMTAEPII